MLRWASAALNAWQLPQRQADKVVKDVGIKDGKDGKGVKGVT